MIPPTALVVLDTNVLVQIARGSAAGKRVTTDYGLGDRPERPLISIVTVGEMKALALKFGWGRPKRDKLDELLRQLVVVRLDQGDIVDRYAAIDHYSEKVIKPARRMGQNDAWIAATASALDAYLLTTDNDFDHLVSSHVKRIKIDGDTGATLSA